MNQFRLLITGMIVIVLGLIAISTVDYCKIPDVVLNAIRDQLVTTANEKVSRVNQMVERSKERVSLVTSRTQLRISLTEYL